MLVFETERFCEEAREHGVWDHALRTSERIRSASTRLEVADRLDKYYAQLLIDKQSNFRLIGDIRQMDDGEDVFVWLRVLVRGGSEYANFGRHAERIRQSVDRRLLDEWYAEQKRLDEEQARPPELPGELVPWLEAPREVGVGADGGYVQVLESADWVKGILETDRVLWADVYACIQRVMDGIDHGRGIDVGILHLEADPARRIGIECYRPDALTLFLSRIVVPSADEPPTQTPALDTVSAYRRARRSYPAWITTDRDQWFEVQDQKESNLSLSPEERTLLDAVAGHGTTDHRLPLFINGQAGSGKSTMLAYIFAGLLARQHQLALDGRPLFITYNQHLLERASETTARLLQHDANFLNKDQTIPDGAFVTWREFLLGLLPSDRQSEFEPQNRIDFHEFKLAWERRGGRLPDYRGVVRRNAEFVWFVIKALIKGSDSAEDLTPEEFPTIASREQTVDADEFANIFHNVYQSWYVPHMAERNLWDDQDLVSAVLLTLRSDAKQTRPTETNALVALVVDEAQDFTRRELRLLTRLLVYANYRVPQYGNPPRIPIILAGDPLQTLSPTGFDWSRIRAAIHEEFGLLFGPAAKVPELEVLNFNYRSSQPIVQVGNSVQLWRSKLFGLEGVRAQSAWNPATALRHPEKFLFSNIREDDFIRFARDTVIIVPSDEGGEADFISQDPTLSRMFRSEQDLTAEGFIFSPVGIKGLEFKKVILYKFGEASPTMEWGHSDQSGSERNLESEYFFNKLYVAVSRATELLFIVDTDEGDRRLWSQFDFDALNHLANRLTLTECSEFAAGTEFAGLMPQELSRETLRSLLGHVEVGAELRDVQEENPKAVADDIRRYGIETRNPTKMRQAAGYYRRSANHELATECEGYALRYEDRLIEAAAQFERARRFDLSWECRWEKVDWEGLASIAERVPNAHVLQRMAVRLMSTPSLRSGDLLILHDGLRGLQQPPRASEPQWAAVCDRLSKIQTDEMVDLEESDLEKIVETLDRMFDRGFRQLGPILARALLGLGDPERALVIAERSSSRLDPELATEIADTIGYPAGLRTLAQAGLHSRVVDLWDDAGNPAASEWHDPVMASLQLLKRHGDVIDLLLEQGRSQKASDYLAELCESGAQRNDDRVVDVIESLAADGMLHEAFALLDRLYEIPTLTALPKSIVLRSRATVAWARAEEERGWPDLNVHMRALLESPATRMRDACRRNDIKDEDVPAVGALVEQALDRKTAMGLYAPYAKVDTRSTRLQKYVRERYLTLAGLEIDAISAEMRNEGTDARRRSLAQIRTDRQDRAREWGYTSFKDIPDVRKAVLGEQLQRVEPSGERFGIKWIVESTENGQRVELTEGNAWVVRYSLTDRKVELSVGVTPDEVPEGVSIKTPGGTTVMIVHGESTQITLINDSEGSETLTVHRAVSRERRRAPANRRSRQRRNPRRIAGELSTARQRSEDESTDSSRGPVGGIKAYKLARELGVDLKELNARAARLGFPRRNGNATFNAEETAQLRKG